MPNKVTKAQFPHLHDADMLSDLTDCEKAIFFNESQVRVYERGASILKQGEMADGMYLVAQGTVEVTYLSQDGHKIIVNHYGPSSVFGLIEAIALRPCAASCSACTRTTVFCCPTPAVSQLLKTPAFMRNFANLSLQILQYDNAFKAVDQFYTAEQRICRYLREFAAQGNGFRESQGYLANAVGCSRQTVNKEIGLLRDRGIVDVAKGHINIRNHAALDQRIADLDTRDRSERVSSG